jgi:hypothetical protein
VKTPGHRTPESLANVDWSLPGENELVEPLAEAKRGVTPDLFVRAGAAFPEPDWRKLI